MSDESNTQKTLLWLKRHFAHRPLMPHLMVWLMVGVLLGIVLAPDQRTTSILAFAIAGTIVAVGLGIATYPLSEHHNLTFTGALTGLAITPVFTVLGIGLTQMAAPLFLIVGTLTGGTCLLWMTPVRFVLRKLTEWKYLFRSLVSWMSRAYDMICCLFSVLSFVCLFWVRLLQKLAYP